jgi:hypothetical protein
LIVGADSIARENVARIVIGQKGRYSSRIVGGLNDDDLIGLAFVPVVGWLLAPVFFGYLGARAEVLWPIEGFARLVPTRVIEIIQ